MQFITNVTLEHILLSGLSSLKIRINATIRSQCTKPEQLVITFAAGYIGQYRIMIRIVFSIIR